MISRTTAIRVWDNSQPKELINPKALYEGNISNLSTNDKVSSKPIVEMMSINGVLVFFIEITQNNTLQLQRCHSDIVKAKDPAQAWSKIKFKHPFNAINGHDIRISEIS